MFVHQNKQIPILQEHFFVYRTDADFLGRSPLRADVLPIAIGDCFRKVFELC